MSPDGRLAAMTVFVSGHSYMSANFSTRTSIVDAASGQEVVDDLEKWPVLRDGAAVQGRGLQFLGRDLRPRGQALLCDAGDGGQAVPGRGRPRCAADARRSTTMSSARRCRPTDAHRVQAAHSGGRVRPAHVAAARAGADERQGHAAARRDTQRRRPGRVARQPRGRLCAAGRLPRAPRPRRTWLGDGDRRRDARRGLARAARRSLLRRAGEPRTCLAESPARRISGCAAA